MYCLRVLEGVGLCLTLGWGRPVAGVSVWLVEAHVLLVVCVSSLPCDVLGLKLSFFFF